MSWNDIERDPSMPPSPSINTSKAYPAPHRIARQGAAMGGGVLAGGESMARVSPPSWCGRRMLRHPVASDICLPTTDVALERLRVPDNVVDSLHYRFFALLVAVGTNRMRGFGRLRALSKRIGQCPSFSVLLQFIPLPLA